MCWICEGWRDLGDDATADDKAAWAQRRGVDVRVDDKGDLELRLYPAAPAEARQHRPSKKRPAKKRR